MNTGNSSGELPASGPHKGGAFKGMKGGKDPMMASSHHEFQAKCAQPKAPAKDKT
jgi:hypothetical protein